MAGLPTSSRVRASWSMPLLLCIAACESRPLPSADDSVGFGEAGDGDGDGDGEATSGPSSDTDVPDLGAVSCEPIVEVLEITNDTDPETVACVEQVLGDLTIRSTTTLVDLDMLANLREVGGRLWVLGNVGLTSLHGLEQLRSVGILEIRRNHMLDDLHGVDALESVQQIVIAENKGLGNLAGLPAGLAPTTLQIIDNAKLVDLAGLPLFVAPGAGGIQVLIKDNATLSDLAGLSDCCAAQPASLDIQQNPSLLSLAGLDGFMRLEALRLHDNLQLLDLGGLDGLVEVGELDVSYDRCAGPNSLSELSGAPALQHVDVLQVQWASELSSLTGFGQLQSLSKLVIRNNEALPWTDIAALIEQTNPSVVDACGGVDGPVCMPVPEPCPMM